MDKAQQKDKMPLTKDEKLDDALDDSFPASDPPSMTDPHRSTVKKKPVPESEPNTTGQKAAD